MQPTLNLVITGASQAELIANGRAMLATLEGGTKAKTGKIRAAAPVVDEETEELDMIGNDDDEETTTTDEEIEMSFDDVEEEVETPAPKAKATKGNGASKLTSKDVNDAALKFAKKHDRKKTLAVLAKFKVKSIQELTPAQYADVIKALKV